MNNEPLVIERFLKADCATVFRAWTDPEVVAKWFFVQPDWGVVVERDLRVGGQYTLTMSTSEGERHVMTGEYLELEPPRRLSFTWSSHVAQNTRVEIELEPYGDGTRLLLRHYLGADPEVRKAHTYGWLGCLGNLERAVA